MITLAMQTNLDYRYEVIGRVKEESYTMIDEIDFQAGLTGYKNISVSSKLVLITNCESIAYFV